MKRLISLLLCCTLFLLLCSCGKEKEKKPPVTIDSLTYTEDFPDESGKVICKLDMTYPVFKSESKPEAAAKISAFFEKVKADAIDSIKSNLQNTKETNERFGIEGPVITKITYEIHENTFFVASVRLTTKTGTNPDEAQGDVRGYSFSLADGSKFSIESLSAMDTSALDDTLKAKIRETANKTYSPRGDSMSDSQLETLDMLYNNQYFCCGDDEISFVYSLKTLSGGAREGTYLCTISFADLEGILITPMQYSERVSG